MIYGRALPCRGGYAEGTHVRCDLRWKAREMEEQQRRAAGSSRAHGFAYFRGLYRALQHTRAKGCFTLSSPISFKNKIKIK